MYILKDKSYTCMYDPQKIEMTVTVGDESFIWNKNARIETKDGKTFYFKDAKCSHSARKDGIGECVLAAYSGFGELDIVINTKVMAQDTNQYLRFEVWVTGDDEDKISELYWPCGFEYNSDCGYTVLPRMQGSLIPAKYSEHLVEIPLVLKLTNKNSYKGVIFERDAYMPMYGQIKKAAGYLAIYDTPYDARYYFTHIPGEDTRIEPFFIPSLGKMAYKRIMLFSFWSECDYNIFAKKYKHYLKETGKFVTLKEKIAQNENVAKLIGTPIIHEQIVRHAKPGTMRYDEVNSENNDTCVTFETRCNQLKALKKKGVDRAYLHFDGWGKNGYDNMHPDVFPPSEKAGGAPGMKKLSDTASALGYVFGIHDQYRDYYYDAESFDMNNAIENEDGSHPFCDVWDGGSHTMLCQSLSPEYVKRNYKNFENLGINIEGAYLDVFGVVPLDECFNPEHRMTRKECCEKRLECFNILTSKGIIPSSEEAVDCMMKGIALCHHAPYFAFLDKEHDKPTPFGIPVPLFNLVWHESLIIPWTKIFKTDFDRWKCIPYTDTPYLHALLNGDTIYLPIEPNEDEIDVCNKVLKLHKRVALEEMVEHKFLDDSYRVQQTVFSDGTKVTVNFDTDEYKISME